MPIARYSVALQVELRKYGRASLAIHPRLTESAARTRLAVAGQRAGLKVTTHRVGDRVTAVVVPVKVSQARAAAYRRLIEGATP